MWVTPTHLNNNADAHETISDTRQFPCSPHIATYQGQDMAPL